MATTRFIVVEENPDTHNAYFLHVEDEFESTFIWGLFKYLYCQCVVMLQSRKWGAVLSMGEWFEQ